ncbi:hypothetical protein RIF29_10271 [Crotalaria pallida]|uniref:Inositol-tetrakisphosphate 1-kinase n=1 Tax=Crotalaria pallida TaxID=3830 RepID=A0AAN9ILQ8_CROPI
MSQSQRYRIGYALHPKKIQNLIRNSLLTYTNQRGIDLVKIDLSKPLIQQGHFHCIIHKLHPLDWNSLRLNEYLAKHPHTVIVDRPDLVQQLHNRVSMLEPMTHTRISLENDTVGVPKQILVDNEAIDEEVDIALKFPVIAKPLFADGTTSSHELCLVLDREGLRTLSDNNNNNSISNTSPMVLQEFVNHGGVVFKVYVAGEHVKCVKRNSLPDIKEEEARTLKGVAKFSQISNLTVHHDKKRSNEISGEIIEKAEMPPEGLIKELGRGLREAMGLNMFNVDVIRDAEDCNRYLVIDINYFPGYAKLPCYEPFITDFLLDSVCNKAS